MADKLKEIPAKILEWWNKFTTRQKSIIVGAAAVVIFAFAIIMYVMSKPQYVRQRQMCIRDSITGFGDHRYSGQCGNCT